VHSVADAVFSGDISATITDIRSAAESGDEIRVYDLAKAALERGLRHPMLFQARANWFWHAGLYYDALADLEAALTYSPRNPLLHSAAGECLLKLGVWRAASRALGAAIELAPEIPQTHYLRGLAFQMNGERQAAISAHRRAVELNPRHANALASLALISSAEGNLESLREYADAVHRLDPLQPTAHIARAVQELREDAVGSARQRLLELLQAGRFGDDPRANDVLRELGNRFEVQGDVPFAFRIYSEVNRKRRAIHSRRFAEHRSSSDIAVQLTYFHRTPAWSPEPVPPSQPEAPRCHVFILGFARTGTTLLETVLASNEEVIAFDEKDCFSQEAKALLRSEEGLETLAILDETQLARMRTAYWEQVGEFGCAAAGKVFVDKWPFNSRRLPLIAKLFPGARILFTIRDPRDVVLSCFRRSFIMNPDTFEFLELEECARFYTGIMDLFACVRQKLPLQILDVRYESLIADFAGTVRTICDFVGLQWSEGMRDFHLAAEGTVDIHAQSGRQVRMSLYSHGAGQWRCFSEQLAPTFPVLSPWIKRFDYPAD
jgi:tetratricopeptide (TPR) repeat protein